MARSEAYAWNRTPRADDIGWAPPAVSQGPNFLAEFMNGNVRCRSVRAAKCCFFHVCIVTHTKEHTGNHTGNLWVGSAVLILNGQKLKENRWTTWVAGFRSQ